MKVHELITWLSMHCKGADDVTLDHNEMLEDALQWGWRGQLNISTTPSGSRAHEKFMQETDMLKETLHQGPDQ